MDHLISNAVGFLGAASLVLILTPRFARLATRLGAVDHPDGRRKNQALPVPRGGGVVIALAAMSVIPLALFIGPPGEAESSAWLTRGLLPSIIILLVVGIIDDVLTLTGIYKLIGQVLAVSMLVATGLQFGQISLLGMLIPLGDFRIPFTIFFCLGAVNAFNLIDGIDGLASSLGTVVCVTLGIITASQGHFAGSAVCFTVAGGLVGFLRYNVSPAKVYLGDTGSMLVGLIVAAVAIESSIKQETAFVLAVPLAICAIPILDAGAALIRRITTGQSVFTADRGHLHHALLLRGWSVNRTVMIIAGLTSVTCAGALVSYYTKHDFIALGMALSVFVALSVAKIFGHAEAALVVSRSLWAARKLLSRGVHRPTPEMESAVQVQGNRKWQTLWTGLREAAPNYNIVGITLQIGIPHLHESFYANWNRNDIDLNGNAWRTSLPLSLDGQQIGKLSIVGASIGPQALVDIQHLLDFLESLHGDIARIAVGGEQQNAVSWPPSLLEAVLN
jgi:UDP-GlcNAc:undecaprenyl-phosphate GlcNAc-1-phosphate transferase